MHKRSLPGAAFGLLVASVAPALAVDNGPSISTDCTCFCDGGANGSVMLDYNDGGLGCSALQNRTCNYETAQGLIRSGTTSMCWAVGETGSQGGAGNGASRPGAVGPLDRSPDPSGPVGPGTAAPLDGTARQ